MLLCGALAYAGGRYKRTLAVVPTWWVGRERAGSRILLKQRWLHRKDQTLQNFFPSWLLAVAAAERSMLK